MLSNKAKYYGGLLVAMFFWGGSWVSGKIVVVIAPPMTIGFFRFLIASVLFLVAIKASNQSIRKVINRKNLTILILLGSTGMFGYGVLFLTGMKLTTAAQGSIIAGFNPVTTTLFAVLLHREKLVRKWQYVGFILSFTGVVFVVGVQALIDFRLDYLLGNLIILGGMVLWGLYSSIGKQAMKRMSPLESIAGGAVFGCMMFGVAMLFEQPWTLDSLSDMSFWINVVYLAVAVTFTGFLLYFIAIQKIGATRAGGFINFVPVFGALLSVLLLQEPFYWTFFIGLILVVSGVFIINFSSGKEHSEVEGQKE